MNSQINEEALSKKYLAKGTMWYLTVLGSLATTQREYVALHAFQNLQAQVDHPSGSLTFHLAHFYHWYPLKSFSMYFADDQSYTKP
jgi:hypothetical protein